MLRRWMDRHERMKNYVHTAFRYPLPPAGQKFMGFVYFLIPVVSGWYIMQWAIQQSHETIGAQGEYLPVKELQGMGKHRQVVVDTEKNNNGTTSVRMIPVGAGGWGGGVHLADSDPETQERNRQMLHKFLKQQQQKIIGDGGNQNNSSDKDAKE